LRGRNRWDEKAGLGPDAISSKVIGALDAQAIRRYAMKRLATKTKEVSGIRRMKNRNLTIRLVAEKCT
jgi:hypothetical protein